MDVKASDFVGYDDARSDSASILGADIVIEGNIAAGNNLTVLGTVTGDVSITGVLEVSGAVNGNLSSRSFHSDCAKVTGNIVAEESVVIGSDAVIIGDVKGNDIEITGAVKGNIDAMGSIHLGSSAIIKGNLKSRSMTVENGAVIAGQCEQCYAEQTADSFFKQLESGGAPDMEAFAAEDALTEPIKFNHHKDKKNRYFKERSGDRPSVKETSDVQDKEEVMPDTADTAEIQGDMQYDEPVNLNRAIEEFNSYSSGSVEGV